MTTETAVALPVEGQRIHHRASEWADALVCTNAGDYARIIDELRDVNDMRARAEASRVSLKAPILEAGKRIDALWNPVINACDAAVRKAKGVTLSWKQADDRARAEEERRIREQQAAEEARLREEAAKAWNDGDTELAADLNFEAEVAATGVVLAPRAPQVAGVNTTTRWHAEVTSLHELVKAAAKNPAAYLPFLMANEKALNDRARSQQDAMNVPGVVARSEQGLTVRRS